MPSHFRMSSARTTGKLALTFLTVLLIAALVGCGGNSSSSSKSPDTKGPVSVVVVPATSNIQATVDPAKPQTVNFGATVMNSTNPNVTWSIQEGATGGTIDSTGKYTAPNANGTYHVIATAVGDTSKTASAVVNVKIPPTITLNKTTDSLHICTATPCQDTAKATYTATVTGPVDTAVNWTLTEANGGTIAQTGNSVAYTAPVKAGTFHLVATSHDSFFSTFKQTVTVTVVAGKPVFTSTPVTAANEGDVYTYVLAATDSEPPSTGTVTFALTSGPTGAKLGTDGKTITWTPAAAQSRVKSDFVVTATTPENMTDTQKWSVTPTGKINGTMMSNYLSATGEKSNPVDLSATAITAVVADSTGAFNTALTGTGKADGTFTIEKVPGGYFYLYVKVDNVPNIYTQAPANKIDLSKWYGGRPGSSVAKAGTTRTIHFDGLNAWGEDDYLTFVNANTNENRWWSDGLLDAIVYDHTQAAPFILADPKQGDKFFAGQMASGYSNGDRFYLHLAKSLALDVTDVDGGDVKVTGKLLDLTGTTAFRPVIAGSQFEAMKAAMGPNAQTIRTDLYLEAHPFGLSKGFLPDSTRPEIFEFLGYKSDAVTTDSDLGNIVYSNPYPTTWPLVSEYLHAVNTTYPDPTNGDTTLVNEIYQATDAIPTAAAPVAPIISPVTAATIDGKNFFTAQTITTNPKISWKAPATGTAQGYEVGVYDLATFNADGLYYPFRTPATDIVLPAGLLQVGHSYVISIVALNEKNADLAAAPLSTGFPHALASATSGVITIQAPAGTPAGLNVVAPQSSATMMKGSKYVGGNAPHLSDAEAARITNK